VVVWHIGCSWGADMGATADRQTRTCIRCGRTGWNAFRPIPTDHGRMDWICTHLDPCVARMRTRHRSGSRRSEGRPPTSPIAPAHLSERPTCVVGSDRASVDALADTIVEFTAADVDRLDPSRRSLDQLSRRDYGLVVIDARPDDPVAFVNELARRLGSSRRRECTLVVCHDPGPLSPALEHLVRRTGARAVPRPVEGERFMDAVRRATGGDLVHAAS
jgi:hypothetical protein